MTSKAGRRALLAVALLTSYPCTGLTAQDTLPVGYGTLKRDDIVVRFATISSNQVLRSPSRSSGCSRRIPTGRSRSCSRAKGATSRARRNAPAWTVRRSSW